MTPERMIRNGNIDSWLDARLRSITAEHDYVEILGLPVYVGDFCLDFARRGSRFPTELLRFTFFQDSESIMVDFIGSQLSHDRLCSEGLAGNSAGRNLFDYQFDVLERSPHEVLKKAISLKSLSESRPLIDRLTVEIREAEGHVWDNLLEAVS